jgi:hypothetical protein
MLKLTSLPAAAVSKEELRVILEEYLALDRARVFRRLFVFRFGLLASASTIVAIIVPGLSAIARWLPPVLFLAPPVWAWIVELRLAQRLSRHLDGVQGVTTHDLAGATTGRSPHKKVVKSS